ncbi:MAG: glycosyltransferase family 4 protein [Solirubrobacterales bacterium]|nr:glycosyltransferase family 4 protein [Solirubrobacterales bacterium]
MAEFDVLLVGPYPPPRGGISAHVQRLSRTILARGLTTAVINHFQTQTRDPLVVGELRRNPWRYWRALRSVQARVVHYHHSRWSTLLATAFALRRCSASTIVTVHGQELEPFLRSRIPGVAWVTRRALRAFDVLIAVSVEIEPSLRSLGRPVKMIPAYLPDHDDQARLSEETEAFLRQGTNLVVAAHRLVADGRGRTIYGLETAIGSFASAAAIRPRLHLAIFVASGPRSRHEGERLWSLIKSVNDDDIRRRIGVFWGEPLTPAFPFTAIYLRPTLTDGDAVSIREALAAGIPVVASDVVRRPPGAVTVDSDISHWREAILQSLECRQPTAGAASDADPAEELMTIYEALGCAPRPLAQPAIS